MKHVYVLSWLIAISSAAADGSFGSPTHRDVPPTPLPSRCLVNSLSAPVWEVTSFRYSVNGEEEAAVTFALTNSMDGSTFTCSATRHSEDGQPDLSAVCHRSNGADSERLVTAFYFDPDTYILTFSQAWTCDENGGSKS
jgi:hypothetical protein